MTDSEMKVESVSSSKVDINELPRTKQPNFFLGTETSGVIRNNLIRPSIDDIRTVIFNEIKDEQTNITSSLKVINEKINE